MTTKLHLGERSEPPEAEPAAAAAAAAAAGVGSRKITWSGSGQEGGLGDVELPCG